MLSKSSTIHSLSGLTIHLKKNPATSRTPCIRQAAKKTSSENFSRPEHGMCLPLICFDKWPAIGHTVTSSSPLTYIFLSRSFSMQASIFNFCRPSRFYLWHFSVSEDEYLRNSKRFPCMATLMFLRLHRLSDYTSNITTGSAYCSHSTWEKGLSVVFLIQMNRETTGFLLFFYLESEQITPYAVT